MKIRMEITALKGDRNKQISPWLSWLTLHFSKELIADSAYNDILLSRATLEPFQASLVSFLCSNLFLTFPWENKAEARDQFITLDSNGSLPTVSPSPPPPHHLSFGQGIVPGNHWYLRTCAQFPSQNPGSHTQFGSYVKTPTKRGPTPH